MCCTNAIKDAVILTLLTVVSGPASRADTQVAFNAVDAAGTGLTRVASALIHVCIHNKYNRSYIYLTSNHNNVTAMHLKQSKCQLSANVVIGLYWLQPCHA